MPVIGTCVISRANEFVRSIHLHPFLVFSDFRIVFHRFGVSAKDGPVQLRYFLLFMAKVRNLEFFIKLVSFYILILKLKLLVEIVFQN